MGEEERDVPLDVALGLGRRDLGLASGVLFLTLGGEGGWCGGAADDGVGSLDGIADELFGGTEQGVDLIAEGVSGD